MGSEAAGLEQGSGDVVGEVAEAEGGAAQVLQPAVDRLRRAVAGAGSVEVGQDILGALLQGPPEGEEFGEGGGDAAAERLIRLLISWRPFTRSGSR